MIFIFKKIWYSDLRLQINSITNYQEFTMTVLFRRTFIRQNNSIPFYNDSPEFTQYIVDTYVTTEKCLAWRSILDTETTRVTESIWATQEDIDTAVSDPIIITNSNETKQYCDENLIDSNSAIE